MASALNPPQGFVDLSTAYTSPDLTFINVIGVVVDLMPPTLSRKGEWTMTFRLLDRKLYGWVSGSEGLSIRFFKLDSTHLPRVQNIGDVVLVRHLKMMTWSGQRSALSNYQTECIVFPSARIVDPNFAIAVQGSKRIETLGIEREKDNFNMHEQSYVMSLKKNMADVINDRLRALTGQMQRREEVHEQEPLPKKQKVNGSFNPKFKLITELTPRIFADLYGEVVKRIGVTYGCDLYITDYTSNELLRQYDPPEKQTSEDKDGDIYGYTAGTSKKSWPGPFGQLTMKINVKPPHAQVANRVLNEGDFVLLQNVKTRVTDAGPWLEGDMWPDDMAPERIKFVKLDANNDPPLQLKGVLQRRAAYWKTRETRLDQKQREEENKAKKKAKKAKKQKKDTSGAQVASGEEGAPAANKPDTKPDKNPHIRCSNEGVPLSTIRSIVDPNDARHTNAPPGIDPYVMPFINVKYRTKVRVIDYEPKDLEDFAVPALPEQDESQDSMAWQYTGSTPKFEWYFSLLLEDATSGSSNNKDHNRIWVQVQHPDAQFLFGNGMEDDPVDLRSAPHLLAKLREKMFVLWGNLEENGGGQGLSNLPFECCIQEYGVEMDDDDPAKEAAPLGWQRMYAMFGVTIL